MWYSMARSLVNLTELETSWGHGETVTRSISLIPAYILFLTSLYILSKPISSFSPVCIWFLTSPYLVSHQPVYSFWGSLYVVSHQLVYGFSLAFLLFLTSLYSFLAACLYSLSSLYMSLVILHMRKQRRRSASW